MLIAEGQVDARVALCGILGILYDEEQVVWERDALRHEQHRRITVTVVMMLLLPIGAPSGCGGVPSRHSASSAEG